MHGAFGLTPCKAKTNAPFGRTALLAAGRANVLFVPMRPCERPVSLIGVNTLSHQAVHGGCTLCARISPPCFGLSLGR